MEPTKLFLENGKPIKQQFCGKCNRIWPSKQDAERCCTCSFCGEYCDWKGSGVTHAECRSKRHCEVESEALEKAVLVSDYRGPFLVDDRYYPDVEELLDDIPPEELPEFGFCTKYQAPYLDLQSVMESVGEMHDDWEPVGEDALAEAFEVWNFANKENGTYWEDRTRKWSWDLVWVRAKGEE